MQRNQLYNTGLFYLATMMSAKTDMQKTLYYPCGKPTWCIQTELPNSMDGTHSLLVSAVAAINSDYQILVGFNRRMQVWDVPQGKMEGGENPLQCAARELFEETGLVIEPTALVLLSKFAHITQGFTEKWITQLYTLPKNYNLECAYNKEPEKCDKLGWYAPIHIPVPRGLSLRILLTLMGYTS